MACDCWWRGSKLYFTAWKPPLMCLAWKILKTLGRDVDRKGIPPKILFISDLSFELWHLCKSMLPSAKGLSIYFYVIYFYCWVITFSYKHQTWELYCHSHALCIVNVVCIMTGSLLPWITMFSRCLNFGGALHLCFAVSERASEIPCCHIISWLFWQSVGIWDILLLLASWLCHWCEWT